MTNLIGLLAGAGRSDTAVGQLPLLRESAFARLRRLRRDRLRFVKELACQVRRPRRVRLRPLGYGGQPSRALADAACHERTWRLAEGGTPGELNGGERGIRTPGPLSEPTVFKTAALNHSAISPRSGHLVLLDHRHAVHERPQGVGDHDRSVSLLIVLENRNQRAADRKT